MSTKVSDHYAPEGICQYCGFKGKDWGFKYHPSSCTKCYQKWKKAQNAEYRRLNPIPPNENINITDDVIITTNVRKILLKKAETTIPYSDLYKSYNLMTNAGWIISAVIPFLYIFFWSSKSFMYILLIFTAIIFVWIWRFSYLSDKEAMKREPLVNNLLVQLAQERKMQIEETKMFYASPEWRLLRKKIISANENVCKNCGKKITEKSDITIDHILPRSKFPKNALEIQNMQVLCRSCNSSKGNKIIDMIDT